MLDFAQFAVLTKVDVAKREVHGIATQEVIDHAGEIMDYESSVPYFVAWSKEVSKDSGGKSLGNIREQHSNIAAGKITAMEFADKEKAIAITVKVVDDQSWLKVEEGVLTGFSIGGSYIKLWKDGDVMRFTAKPVEISLVDRPCCPTAILDSIKSRQYEFVKADGTSEMRKFEKKKEVPVCAECETALTADNEDEFEQVAMCNSCATKKRAAKKSTEKKTKRVANEDLDASCFAYVGDPEDPKTWKLPIKFSDDAKTKTHIRNALARFNQTKGIPADKKDEVKAKIEAAAKKHGIDVSDDSKKALVTEANKSLLADFQSRIDKAAVAKGMEKGLYALSEFADVLQTMFYLYRSALYEADCEQDDSTMPDELREHLNSLAETFLAMAEEEINELTASAAEKGVHPMSDLLKAALKNHFKKSKSFHERKAARHQAIAKAHNDAVTELEKSDTPEAKATAALYKATASDHEALMRSELSQAEHLGLMSEAADEDATKAETAAKAVETSLTKTTDEPSAEAVAEMKKNAVSTDVAAMTSELMAKTAAEMTTQAVDNFKNSEEGKALFAKAAAEAIAAQVGQAVAPTQVKSVLQPRPGQPAEGEMKKHEPTATAGL